MVVQIHDNILIICMFIYLMNISLSLIIPDEICQLEPPEEIVPEISVESLFNPFTALQETLTNIYKFFNAVISGAEIANCLPPGFDIFYRALITMISILFGVSFVTWVRGFL